MDQTYSESARGVLIDQRRVEQEIRAHAMSADDIEDFLGEVEQVGKGLWDAGDVLDWLGY